MEGPSFVWRFIYKVYNIYTEYEKVYSKLKQEALDKAESDDEKIFKKDEVSDGSLVEEYTQYQNEAVERLYVTTLMNSLRKSLLQKRCR